MALTDNKQNVFTTIGAYTSLNQTAKLPTNSNSFSSINNKNEVIPFMLDILKVVVGSEALQDLVGQLFVNLINTVEPNLKTSIKKQNIQSNSNDLLPSTFVTNGITVPVKNIDIYGKYKTNPSSNSGSLLYNKSAPNFDATAYQAILNAGTGTIFNNFIITYDPLGDNFNFKPTSAAASLTIGDFLNDFIDNIILISTKEFMTNVMNLFYGSITNHQNKTIDQVTQELQVNQLINQIVNNDNSFEITSDDNNTLLTNAKNLANGVTYYNLGCGIMASSLPLSGMTNLIGNISGSTDPHFIGNQINNTIPNTASDLEAQSQNQQTIKDGFFQKLIDLIKLTLAQAVSTTPQIRMLLSITSFFQNGKTLIGNPINDLKNFKTFINCNIDIAMKLINKFIFDLIVTALTLLLEPVIKKIIKEKINLYTGILQSLISIGIE